MRRKILMPLSAVIILLATFLSLYYYSESMRKKIILSTFSSVEETAWQQRQNFVWHINQMYQQLNLCADIMQLSHRSCDEDIIQLLTAIARQTLFCKIVFSEISGASLSSDGESADLNEREYFKEATEGKKFMSDPFISDIDGERYCAISTPVYLNNTIQGVLTGLLDLKNLSSSLHSSFSGFGRTYVLTPSGVIVATSNTGKINLNHNLREIFSTVEEIDFDSRETLFANLDKGVGGKTAYSFNGEPLLMRYEPVGVKDWFIASIAEYEYVSNELSSIMQETGAFASLLILVIATLFSCIYYDYGRLQRSEREIKQAEEYNSLMLNSVPLGCSLWNENIECFACNDLILKLYGMKSHTEFVEKLRQYSQEYQPNGRLSEEYIVESLQKALDTGYEQFEWEHKNMIRGASITFEVTLVRVKYKDGYVIAAYQRDLSKQKAAEAEMMELEMYTYLIMNAMPVACVLWDNNMKPVFCNEATIRLYGVGSKQEFIDSFDLCSPKYQPNGYNSKKYSRELVRKTLKEGHLKFEWLHKNLATHDFFPCEVTLVRIRHKSNYVVAGYVRDLREQKAMIAEIEARKKLEGERDATEKSSKAKLQFLANMSHEIRTPMNAIVGISGLLLETTLDERQRKYVRDIQISSDTLLGIINDILDFSKLNSGKMELVCKSFDFNIFLEHMASVGKHIISGKKLAFSFGTEGEIPRVLFGDQTRLRQVLWNIIGNSAKYTNEGSVSLEVIALEDSIKFSVSDTGVGIKEENIPFLFDAFSQFDRDKNANVVGTGLGLSIAKGYVDLMGGKIEVKSVYGEGSVFSVIIPKVLGNADDVEQERNDKILVAKPNAKVLVIDDNEINLHVAAGIFEQFGIYIITASGALEAIEMIKQEKYDIIFMDHMMPGMDGVEATHVIRALGSAYSRLPIIALTANAFKGVKEMFLNEGMNDFISKPIDRMELNRVLIRWLPSDKINTVDELPPDDEPDKYSALKRYILDEIPEINANIGLTRAGGKWESYKSSLELFSRRTPEYVKKLFEYADLSDYAITVHALKGVLATFGIMSLSSLAADLEAAAKSGNSDFCKDNTGVFAEKLSNLGNRLSDIFSRTAEVKMTLGTCPPELFSESVQKIRESTENFDNISAVAHIDELLSYTLDEGYLKKLTELRYALEEFDFDAASDVLKNMG